MIWKTQWVIAAKKAHVWVSYCSLFSGYFFFHYSSTHNAVGYSVHAHSQKLFRCKLGTIQYRRVQQRFWAIFKLINSIVLDGFHCESKVRKQYYYKNVTAGFGLRRFQVIWKSIGQQNEKLKKSLYTFKKCTMVIVL